jgi:hypothetical protein
MRRTPTLLQQRLVVASHRAVLPNVLLGRSAGDVFAAEADRLPGER